MIQVTVDNATDIDIPGITNLRQAVAQVEAGGGGQISIDPSITEIQLLSPLDLTGDISIFGTATGTIPNVTIFASNGSRVLGVAAGADVTLFGLEITGGVNRGTIGTLGTFGNGGTNVSLPSPLDPAEASTNNGSVRDSNAGGGQGQGGGVGGTGGTAEGGGIFNQGTLTIIDGSVTNNTVTGGIGGLGGTAGPGGEGGPGRNGAGGEESGGVGGHGGNGGNGGNGGTGGTAEGGGIFNKGTVVLVNTLVTGNVANGGSGGFGGDGGQGGEGGHGGDASTLIVNGNDIGTGQAGAGGLGGGGGAGGEGGTGGIAVGNNIENQGAVVEVGTSVIIGAGESTSGAGGGGGSGGARSESGVTGSGNGSNSDPTPSSPGTSGASGAMGADGSADIDNNGALLRVVHNVVSGKVGTAISLSGISVVDSQSSFSVKLSTDFGTLSIVEPGQTTPTQATSLVLSGNIANVDIALDTLSLQSATPGTGDVTITLQDVDHAASTFVSASVICFLAGTLIQTPRGDVPIEHLTPGDRVVTLGGKIRPIVWIGMGRVLATRARRNAATPVIVRKGALGDNIPHTDLRITKAHALYVDGILVPAEFLVNHRTILWDDHAQEVTIYHVELETHDVLLANGALAESYRDDGNRWLFQNANSGWSMPPQEPCAPVLTGGPLVDAIWQRLMDRAGKRRGLPLTGEADLHLLVDGRRVDPAHQVGEIYIFRLAEAPSTLQIVSRAAAPDELGLARDPRPLGVALRCLVLRKMTRFEIIGAGDQRLENGFHAFEPDNNIRWTGGNATLQSDIYAGFTGPFDLVLHVAATTLYQAEGPILRVA